MCFPCHTEEVSEGVFERMNLLTRLRNFFCSQGSGGAVVWVIHRSQRRGHPQGLVQEVKNHAVEFAFRERRVDRLPFPTKWAVSRARERENAFVYE